MNKILIGLLALSLGSCGKKVVKVTGPAGSSCTVVQDVNGATIFCTDGTSAFVANGLNGLDGNDGVTDLNSLVSILTPCPQNANSEILLKFSNGVVVALYDGGAHQDRLIVLQPNVVYQTSDHNNPNQVCEYKVDTQGNLTVL
jgi:hypothetical protein